MDDTKLVRLQNKTLATSRDFLDSLMNDAINGILDNYVLPTCQHLATVWEKPTYSWVYIKF